MAKKIGFAMRAFLFRVARGEVYATAGYTARRGGYTRFYGGEATAKKAAKAGLIHMPRGPELGRPAYATLTEAGRAVLQVEGTK